MRIYEALLTICFWPDTSIVGIAIFTITNILILGKTLSNPLNERREQNHNSQMSLIRAEIEKAIEENNKKLLAAIHKSHEEIYELLLEKGKTMHLLSYTNLSNASKLTPSVNSHIRNACKYEMDDISPSMSTLHSQDLSDKKCGSSSSEGTVSSDWRTKHMNRRFGINSYYPNEQVIVHEITKNDGEHVEDRSYRRHGRKRRLGKIFKMFGKKKRNS